MALKPEPGAGLYPKASVIVVNYNSGKLLMECIDSVLHSSLPVEVLVSDNASSDDSVDQLRQAITDERLHIHRQDVNLGFAAANNAVLPQASGEFLLFLNPDCIIRPDTIERMLRVMADHPQAGMAGCLIRNVDGSEQAGCRRRVPTPARSLVRILHLDRPFPFLREKGMAMLQTPLPTEPTELEAISGAFMLVRRKALEDVGPLDAGYFLHCEDLDWCMRFRQQGWKILFVPDVEIMHVKGGCSSKCPVQVEWHKHKGMVRFYRKFFRHQYPALLMWMVIAAVWLRFAALSVVIKLRRFAV